MFAHFHAMEKGEINIIQRQNWNYEWTRSGFPRHRLTYWLAWECPTQCCDWLAARHVEVVRATGVATDSVYSEYYTLSVCWLWVI